MTSETGKKTGGKKPAVKTTDRAAVKAKLTPLKKAREAAKEEKDATKLARIRRDYRRAVHALRKSAAPKKKQAKKE